MFSLTECLVIGIVALLVLKPQQLLQFYNQARKAQQKITLVIENMTKEK